MPWMIGFKQSARSSITWGFSHVHGRGGDPDSGDDACDLSLGRICHFRRDVDFLALWVTYKF